MLFNKAHSNSGWSVSDMFVEQKQRKVKQNTGWRSGREQLQCTSKWSALCIAQQHGFVSCNVAIKHENKGDGRSPIKKNNESN